LKKPLKVSEVAQIFYDYYSNQPFVKIIQESNLQTSAVIDSNDCYLQISIDEKTNQITVVSVIDNLIKGASGQAIQNMNLMCGWDQTLGLVDQK
jgi:N-acetyl-gamma-glutamyl-phosphate reductase